MILSFVPWVEGPYRGNEARFAATAHLSVRLLACLSACLSVQERDNLCQPWRARYRRLGLPSSEQRWPHRTLSNVFLLLYCPRPEELPQANATQLLAVAIQGTRCPHALRTFTPPRYALQARCRLAIYIRHCATASCDPAICVAVSPCLGYSVYST